MPPNLGGTGETQVYTCILVLRRLKPFAFLNNELKPHIGFVVPLTFLLVYGAKSSR